MENQIVRFENRDDIRIINDSELTWFCAKDVCTLLGLSNSSQALSRLDSDERGSFEMSTLGGSQKTAFVSESGLYALVLRSKKPEAKAFRKWITSEVLPSIRKNGFYADIEQKLTSLSTEQVMANIADFWGLKNKMIDSSLKDMPCITQYDADLKNEAYERIKSLPNCESYGNKLMFAWREVDYYKIKENDVQRFMDWLAKLCNLDYKPMFGMDIIIEMSFDDAKEKVLKINNAIEIML